VTKPSLHSSSAQTFDLDPEQDAWVRKVREVAERAVSPAAVEIDRAGLVSDSVVGEIERLAVWGRGPVYAILAIEELAAASGAAAARAALGSEHDGESLAGLRGIPPVPVPTDRQRLGVAAVALGIGRRALDEALRVLKAAGDRPTGDPDEPPHWALADAATELEAARLLVRAAAGAADLNGAALAQVFAAAAAVRVVDAAIRIVGPDALRTGAVLERSGRDASAARLIAGTEDDARRLAADHLLGPRR
jgi:hypothetical protein